MVLFTGDYCFIAITPESLHAHTCRIWLSVSHDEKKLLTHEVVGILARAILFQVQAR